MFQFVYDLEQFLRIQSDMTWPSQHDISKGRIAIHLMLILLSCRKDAFTGKQYLQEGMHMEQASVLFNLG